MPVTYNKQDAVKCWPAGEYQATLEKVEDKKSKTSGNAMQVWTFRAYSPDGQEQLISEYVTIPNGTFRIKQLAAALGKSSEFDSETFQADDQIGSNVLVDLIVETQAGYDDKNRVKKIKMIGEPSTVEPEIPLQRQSPPQRQPSRGASSRPAQQQSPPFGGDTFDESQIPFSWSDTRTPL